MNDILPFPSRLGNTPEEQIQEVYNYLIQFKEALEFVLDNISTENLSPDLLKMLNELGANIRENNTIREEEIAQLSGNISNVNELIWKIKFTVNFDTGHLEYTI